MNRMMKVLAIAALVVTIAGAGAVLYGVNTLVPVVEHVSVVRTSAGQEADAFQAVMEQAALGTFSGRVFAETNGVTQENAAFVTEYCGWTRIDCARNGVMRSREEIHAEVMDKLRDLL